MNKQISTAVLDAVISVVLLLSTRYLSPTDLDLVKSLVFALQPLALALIAAQTYSDKVQTQARVDVHTTAMQHGTPQAETDQRIASALGKE